MDAGVAIEAGVAGGERMRSLLSRAKAGDLAAFEDLMREYERPVLRLAFRLTGNLEDAKDVAQEVFLRLHRSMAKLDPDRDPSPWIYRVAMNCANDLLRTRRPVAELPDEASGEPDPEQRAAGRQLHDLVARAVRTLPAKERSALLLRDVAGLSTSEVAEVLDSSEGTVRSQISTARAKLRAVLDRAGGSLR